jgi:hypothetical protein
MGHLRLKDGRHPVSCIAFRPFSSGGPLADPSRYLGFAHHWSDHGGILFLLGALYPDQNFSTSPYAITALDPRER